jgi:hypothetical protein
VSHRARRPDRRALKGDAQRPPNRFANPDQEADILAKAATSAALLLAVAGFAGCGSSGDEKVGLTDKSHKEFVAGCKDGGAPDAFCECLYDELVKKQGVDTEQEFSDLQKEASKAGSDPSAVPDKLRKAAVACKDTLQ